MEKNIAESAENRGRYTLEFMQAIGVAMQRFLLKLWWNIKVPPPAYCNMGVVGQGRGQGGGRQGRTAIFFVEVHQKMVHLKVC